MSLRSYFAKHGCILLSSSCSWNETLQLIMLWLHSHRNRWRRPDASIWTAWPAMSQVLGQCRLLKQEKRGLFQNAFPQLWHVTCFYYKFMTYLQTRLPPINTFSSRQYNSLQSSFICWYEPWNHIEPCDSNAGQSQLGLMCGNKCCLSMNATENLANVFSTSAN